MTSTWARFNEDMSARFSEDMSAARQLVTMVKWRMTLAQALRAATMRGVMQNDIGALEAGKYAEQNRSPGVTSGQP